MDTEVCYMLINGDDDYIAFPDRKAQDGMMEEYTSQEGHGYASLEYIEESKDSSNYLALQKEYERCYDVLLDVIPMHKGKQL